MSEIETVELGSLVVPRIFNGLWQLSGLGWGCSPVIRIKNGMRRYLAAGYTACTDHYGSAEQIFGAFRCTLRLEDRKRVICATKWCIFSPIDPTFEHVLEAVQDRLDRTGMQTVDLLQLHWNDYSTGAYITALQHLKTLQRAPYNMINSLGIVNFDAVRTDKICTALGPGAIVSNQVQFSLIDTRPLHGMSDVCAKHDVKLLTYGTLCGGFLSDKFLGKALPDAFADDTTPSQRKAIDFINVWGDWALFQLLLRALRTIGARHGGRSISVIATRWILDHQFVAAVIVGTRFGIADHVADNNRVFGFRLTPEDNATIQEVLALSNARDLVGLAGDCGAEYRKDPDIKA